MNREENIKNITFTENGHVDIKQLNMLYQLIGWDNNNRRTETKTKAMLDVSHYYVAAHNFEGTLVGFTRVCGDPYVVQVLDVITHPNYRKRGIANQCMQYVLAHLEQSSYVSVTLTDGSGLTSFYQKFGFRNIREPSLVWERKSSVSSECDNNQCTFL